MANICNTELRISSEQLSENKIKEIRNYIEDKYAYCGEIYSDEDYEIDDYMVVECGTKWNVMTDELIKMAKKFRISIRAVGREDGIGFIQVVGVSEDGSIYKDEEIEL